MAHMCGLCLALRDDHGHLARITTNYDSLVISVLVEAQSERAAGTPGARRKAGPCPLRGMRSAGVARGEGARLAAAVSLVLASVKIRDHLADGDGLLARRPVAAAARRMAARWDREGASTGADLGFDTAVLVEAAARQPVVEAAAGAGTPLLEITEPTETATAAAFGYTAVLAGRPGNRAPLEEAGRLFGRLAHLLDAVEDLAEDVRTGAWNPLTATGTGITEARRLCDDAVHGIRLALRDVEFTDGKLVHALLVHELERAVDRAFGTAGHACAKASTPAASGNGTRHGSPVHLPPGNPFAPGGGPDQPPGQPPEPPRGGRRRGLLAGCAVWAALFCTCQICCSSAYHDPWTGERREGLWHQCSCDGDCCECCSNCGNCCEGEGGDGCCCDGCDCCDCSC